MTAATPATTEAVDFLRRWAPEGGWHLTAIVPDQQGTETRSFFPRDSKAMQEWIADHTGRSNVYWHVNAPRAPLVKKAAKSDIGLVLGLQVDVDDPNEAVLERLRTFSPAPTAILFSGGGWQAFWRLREPLPVGGDTVVAVEAANRWLAQQLGGDHCHNVDRLMRLPGTVNLPNATKRARGREPTLARLVEFHDDRLWALDEFGAVVAEPDSAAALRTAEAMEPEPLDLDNLPLADEGRELIQTGDALAHDGDRSRATFAAAVALAKAGATEGQIVAVLLDPGNGISAHCRDQSNPRRAATRAAARATLAAGDFDRQTPKRDATPGAIIATPHSIRVALAKLGVEFSYDEFAGRMLLNGEPLREDYEIADLRIRIIDTFRFTPGKEFFYDAFGEATRRNSFHPVRDYLDGLTWDEEPRLDAMLAIYFGAPDDKYTRAVGSLWMKAAVRRIRAPGCKFDEILVLEGEQGTNKSTALKVLAGGPEWFTDELALSADSKTFLEQCGGKWIVEFGELSGIKRGEIEHVKATASRTHDRARMAYGREPIERPRSCVFAGTTNDAAYLRDSTGGRRFWPVATGRIDLDALRRDRDQLWAEAAAREAAGESIRMPEALWDAAGEHQEARRVGDPWEEDLTALHEAFAGQPVKVQARALWAALSVPTERRSQEHNQRLGAVMRQLGFERTTARFNGAVHRAYVRDADGGGAAVVAVFKPVRREAEDGRVFDSDPVWRASTVAGGEGDDSPL